MALAGGDNNSGEWAVVGEVAGTRILLSAIGVSPLALVVDVSSSQPLLYTQRLRHPEKKMTLILISLLID